MLHMGACKYMEMKKNGKQRDEYVVPWLREKLIILNMKAAYKHQILLHFQSFGDKATVART